MTNFPGELLSYTAVDGCCNFHRWSSRCFVLRRSSWGSDTPVGKGAQYSCNCPALSHDGSGGHSWQGAPGLMQHVLPGESSQGILLAPPAFLFPKSLTGVCQFQPFYFSSFSAGTSGLWTWHINVPSAISSEAFELCSHFPVPTFISPVSLPRQLIHATTAGCPQLAGRQLCNYQVCSKKNECQQRWHPVFLLVTVSFLRQ